jgi:two-component system, cell cycle sensor histidine kinase and response regulator CckA
MQFPPDSDGAAVAVHVLDGLLEGCQVIGFDWTYRFLNATAERQAGRPRSELVGRTMMECYPGIERTAMFAELQRCMHDRQPHLMDNEFAYPDGSRAWFELRFIPVPEGMCVLSIDITDRKKAQSSLAVAEEQLRHAQKMDAVGRLAGGIAHDFNNLLTVILSYSSLALESAQDPNLRAEILEIRNAGTRAADLTRQLLTFSRRNVVAPVVVDLNESVRGMQGMIERLVGEDVDIRVVTTPEAAPVRADPGQVHQVLLNLVVNARDAMPGGGKLMIETAHVMLDEDYAAAHLGTSAGPHVMLAVSDTGIGMDRTTRERLFEPFFTTKPAGRGTGLGLSIVFGIVQQSGGSIWVYSEQGRGTTFKVYFPLAGEIAHAAADRAALPTRPPVETGTILVMEDDAQLRFVAAEILRRAGYTVLDAETPVHAERIATDRAGTVDLILTDVVLPNINGLELADRLKSCQPQAKVLFMSGYTGDAAVHQGLLRGDRPYLQKPFTPRTLMEAVRKVLDAA